MSTLSLWCMNFTIGILFFSLASLSPVFSSELGFSDAQLSVLFSLPNFIFVFLGWLPGIFADKAGPGKTMTIGFTLITAPALVRVLLPTYTMFLATTFIQSLGIALTSPVSSIMIKSLDLEDNSKAVGIVNTGMTVGTWVSHLSAYRLACLTGSWKFAVSLFFIISAVMGILSTIFVCRHSTHHPLRLAAGKDTKLTAGRAPAVTIDTKKITVALCLINFGILGASFAINNWLPLLLTYKSFTVGFATSCSSLYSMGSFVITFAMPFVYAKSLDNSAITIPSALAIVAALLLLSATSSAQISAAVVLFEGLAIGFVQLLVQYQIVENAPADNAGKYSSKITCAGNLGASISVIAVGMISGGGYVSKIIIICIFPILVVIGGAILTKSFKKLHTTGGYHD